MTFETPSADGGSGRIVLKPAQEAALAELETGALTELTRADYQALTEVSRSQAAYDLADLVTLGVFERVGAGRATRYRLGHGAGGRTRKWTEDRIRDELSELCGGLGRWPRRIEFQKAGRGDLYLAASRYGGIAYWAAELGLREPARERVAEAKERKAAPVEKRRVARAAPTAERANLRKGAMVIAGALLFVAATYGGLLLAVDRGPTVPDLPQASRTGDNRDAQAAPQASRTGDNRDAQAAPEQPPQAASEQPRKKPQAAAPAVAKEPESGGKAPALRLAAAGGSCWLEVRRGSAEGRLLFEGTLAAGHRQTFSGRRLWIRLGAPGNLRARLDGQALDLPERTSTVLVTRRGLRVLDVARPASPPPPAPADEREPSDDTVVVSSTPSSTDTSEPSTTFSAPTSSTSSSSTGSGGSSGSSEPTASTTSEPSGPPSPDAPTGSGSGPTPDPTRDEP